MPFYDRGEKVADVLQYGNISSDTNVPNNANIPLIYEGSNLLFNKKLLSYNSSFYRTYYTPNYIKSQKLNFARAGWFPTKRGGYAFSANRYIVRSGASISINTSNSYNSGYKMDVPTGINGNTTVGTHLINIALQGGGGGGGGGTSASNSAGGGGAGGFFGGTVYLPDNMAYGLIVIGAGGTGNTSSDQDGGSGGNTHIELHFNDSSWVPWIANANGGSGGRGGKSNSGTAGAGGAGGTASVGETAYAQAHVLITGASGGAQNNAGGNWTARDVIDLYTYTHTSNISLGAQSGGSSESSNTGGGGGAGAFGSGASGYHSGVPAAAPVGGGGGGGGGNAWFANNTGGVGGGGYAQVWY